MNKIIINLIVPSIGTDYDVLIPINKLTSEIYIYLRKAIIDFSGGVFPMTDKGLLINALTGEKIDLNKTIKENNVKNNSKIILF